jgi:hypothetical protein
VQQIGDAAQGGPDVEQPPDQRGDPGQGPPLVLIPPVRRRALIQLGAPAGSYRPGRSWSRQLGHMDQLA